MIDKSEIDSYPLKNLLSDFCTLQEQRISVSNEINTSLKDFISSRNESEYKRKMKNQAEMFMSLSQELKEIKEKLAEKGETEVVDLIEQIQDGEKRRLPMMTKLHELIINDLDAHKNNEEINRLTKEMGEVGEEINDAISELKLLINAKTMEKK